MAKFRKILCLILALSLALVIFCGCGLFELNQKRYREQTAVEVGDIKISLGEVIDFFDANISYYIQQGMEAQAAWDSLYPQFINKAIILNEQVKKANADNPTGNTSELAKKYSYAQYLSDEQINYLIKYTYYSIFQSIDSTTLDELKTAEFIIGEDEATERVTLTDKGTLTSLADDEHKKDTANLDKMFAKKYLAQVDGKYTYVFSDENDETLTAVVKALNKRLEKKDVTKDKDITNADYIKAQKSAFASIERNLQKSRGQSFDEFMKSQIEDAMRTDIVSKFTLEINKATEMLDSSAKMITNLKQRYDVAKAAEEEKYRENPASFETFITGLTNTSFIYTIPQNYVGEFAYVKNILIPFSDEQTKLLDKIKAEFGEYNDNGIYQKAKHEMVAKIEVKNYKDSDEGIVNENYKFSWDGGTLKSQILTDITNAYNANSADRGVMDFIYNYNTDPGMFNAAYDYVISKSPRDLADSNQSKFVKEFTKEARLLVNNPNQKVSYAVTSFGVHILVYAGEVVANAFDATQRYNYGTGAGTANYRFFKTYYDAVKNENLDKIIDTKFKEYKDGKLIKENKSIMQMFLDNYKLKVVTVI